MSDWEVHRFGDLYAIPARNGVSVPKGDRTKGTKMINMGELFRFDRIGDPPMARVPLTDRELDHSRVNEGDLLFARRSLKLSGAGRCALVARAEEERTFESSIIRVRLDPRRSNPDFYFYLFRSPVGQALMSTIVEQVAVAGIRSSDLANLPVPTPPLAEQRAIADVLGALDDKIESNRQLITVATKLARVEADHWRDGVTAWETTTFGEFAQVFGGATPRTTVGEYWGGGRAWATPSDVTRLGSPYLFATDRTLTDSGLASCSAEMHPPGTIMMTSRATIGAFAIPQVPCATNQGFIVVRPARAEHRWFLLDEMQRRVPEMLERANGSTFLELSRGNFKNMAVDVPADPAEFAGLHATLSALHERGARAASESRTLAELRDALLPELLSGRLRVPVAEEIVESAT